MVAKAFNLLQEKLAFLSEVIKLVLGRSQTLDSIFERLEAIKVQLERLAETNVVGYCYWYETIGRQFGLHITPLTVADKFCLVRLITVNKHYCVCLVICLQRIAQIH